MADYSKATNFTAKDTLPTGNAGKIVKGSEIDTELTAVSSAIASKSNINSPTFTGTPAAPTASSGTNTTQLATTAFVKTAVNALGTMALQNASSVAITGGTITGITDLTVADGGTGRSTLTANAVLIGNGTSGINSVAPGTLGNVLTSDGTAWTATQGAYPLTFGTSQATTSGSTVTFTSIPSWVRRITIMFKGISTNGTAFPQMVIQIGSGSLVTTGYTSVCTTTGAGTDISSFTNGFAIRGDQNSSALVTGTKTLTLYDASSNTWIESGVAAQTVSPYIFSSSGFLTLSGVLDRVALVTTDTFDAGAINILYE